MTAMSMFPAASKPYLHSNVPSVGDTIIFRGLNETRVKGTVTAFKHVPTDGVADRWGVFVATESGPAYINDYRVMLVAH